MSLHSSAPGASVLLVDALPQLLDPAGAQRIMVVNVLLILALAAFFLVVVFALIRHSTRQRVAAARLAAMGTATGRILHQVKNPLQTILLHAEMLEDDGLASEPTVRRELCGAIVTEAARMAELLRRLSTFASGLGQQLSADPVALHEVVDTVAARVAFDCEAAGVDLVIGQMSEVVTAGDVAHLASSLEALVRNALDAVRERAGPGAGRIELSLRRRGGGAMIEVRDNGVGIEEDDLEEVFEPFVTTKIAAIGLGLPLAREVVEGHGGRLELRSRPGQGTVAGIILPIRAARSVGGESAQGVQHPITVR